MQPFALQILIGPIAALAASTAAGADARSTSLGPVVFYATLVSHSWGYRRQGIYVSTDGNVYAFQYGPAEPDWNPAPNAKGQVTASDLQERFSHHPRWLLKLDEQEMQQRESSLASFQHFVGPTAPHAPRYDQGTVRLGVYRLDTPSGGYADTPLCVNAEPQKEPPLCKWLESLLQLSNRSGAP